MKSMCENSFNDQLHDSLHTAVEQTFREWYIIWN